MSPLTTDQQRSFAKSTIGLLRWDYVDHDEWTATVVLSVRGDQAACYSVTPTATCTHVVNVDDTIWDEEGVSLHYITPGVPSRERVRDEIEVLLRKEREAVQTEDLAAGCSVRRFVSFSKDTEEKR